MGENYQLTRTLDFFDSNYENPLYARQTKKLDVELLCFIKNSVGSKENFLDIGGGNGLFAAAIKNEFPQLDVTVVEPSRNLLYSSNIENINKVWGSIPDNLNIKGLYDYISCIYVFHHITGNTIQESKNLLEKSIEQIKDHLKNDGYLIIYETYYDGYIYPSWPRTIIFYLLQIQNTLNIKLPISFFLKNLSICFYSKKELISILEKMGLELVYFSATPLKKDLKFKILGVAEWGRIILILKKINCNKK